MKILVTAPKGVIFDRHFPPDVIGRLEKLGEVRFNPYTRQFTRDELKKELADVGIVMTHWGSTQYDAELLDAAPELKILAHCAGTVAHIASEECYRRNIHVLSANSIRFSAPALPEEALSDGYPYRSARQASCSGTCWSGTAHSLYFPRISYYTLQSVLSSCVTSHLIFTTIFHKTDYRLFFSVSARILNEF